jgi:hypothetical protein
MSNKSSQYPLSVYTDIPWQGWFQIAEPTDSQLSHKTDPDRQIKKNMFQFYTSFIQGIFGK